MMQKNFSYHRANYISTPPLNIFLILVITITIIHGKINQIRCIKPMGNLIKHTIMSSVSVKLVLDGCRMTSLSALMFAEDGCSTCEILVHRRSFTLGKYHCHVEKLPKNADALFPNFV